ncbi:MAG: hypothetical protein H3C36_15485, partial [Chitinophagaceae bacterium]|nr:hypothetical protein [Chitinophagaceae bacterium]
MIQQIANEEVSFEADISGGTAGFRIWVDWNQDGEFTADEVAYQSSGYANSQTGSFQVPASALSGETRMRVVSHWLSTTGDVDPCATGFTYGEFEDYKFVVQALTPCTGTPDGGTAAVTPDEGNVGSTYQVSSTGYSIASGMSFQWESNTDGAGWIDEGTPTDFYEAVSATAPDEVGVEVEWRLKVTCVASNESSYSSVATFTTVKLYCTPGATDASRYISSFSTTGGNPNITNDGTGFSAGGYGDYYDTHSVGQVPGESVNFNVSIQGGTAGFRIWVDWNQDGTFDADEVAYASAGYLAAHSGSFTVPAAALEGETRMRIASHWLSTTGDVNPCATGFTYGEFEDYKFVVAELTPCDGTPEAGTAAVAPAIGAPDSTYIVSASGFSINTGLSFQWESNTDGAGWVDEGTATDEYETFSATAPSEMDVQVEWRLKVTCTASNQSAYSTTATFTTGIVYCTPAAN